WTRPWVPGFRRLGDALARRRWAAVAVLFGVGPVALDVLTGVAVSHALTPLVGWALLLAAVASDRAHPALTALCATFLLHSAAVIALAAVAPEALAQAHPAGAGYWAETEHWLRTGQGRAYDVGAWGPAHARLAAVMVAWGYLSLGLVPLLQGVRELDLMNFYVGRLVAGARGPAPALLLAWHPWSVCRGVGFLFLTFELASLSLSRIARAPLSPVRRRLARLAAGVGFLALDAAVKWSCSEAVRRALAAQLAD
ncbi:MAG: hypothetical protein K2V38_21730, partial [Gemmataceae bacterium]|nr:hypothetical protein [Gemmataceae bacterium]